jgi:hypothetical protein
MMKLSSGERKDQPRPKDRVLDLQKAMRNASREGVSKAQEDVRNRFAVLLAGNRLAEILQKAGIEVVWGESGPLRLSLSGRLTDQTRAEEEKESYFKACEEIHAETVRMAVEHALDRVLMAQPFSEERTMPRLPFALHTADVPIVQHIEMALLAAWKRMPDSIKHLHAAGRLLDQVPSSRKQTTEALLVRHIAFVLRHWLS